MIERTRRKGRASDERGASLVEYALLVALIAVVCIGAVTFLCRSGIDKMQGAGEGVSGSGDTTCIESGGSHYYVDENGMGSGYIPGPCP